MEGQILLRCVVRKISFEVFSIPISYFAERQDVTTQLEAAQVEHAREAAELGTLLHKARSDRELAQQDSEDLEEEATMAFAERDRVKTELETERTERHNIANELETLKVETSFKEEASARQEQELTDTKKQLAASTSRMVSLKKEIESLTSTAAISSDADVDTRNAMAAALVEAEERERELQAVHTAQTKVVEGLEAQVIELGRQISTEQSAMTAQLETVSQLKRELADARETADAKTAELREVCESIDLLTQQAHTNDNTIADLEAHVARAERELISEHSASQAQVQEILTDLATMHEDLRKMTDSRNAAEKAMTE